MKCYYLFCSRDFFMIWGRYIKVLCDMRECWNWQTGKTKDLVSDTTCGFKSHLPH